MVVTPSFTIMNITFCNQRFSSCSPTVDVRFVKLTSDSFCGNCLQDEYSVVLPPTLQYCDFSTQSISVGDNLFPSMLLFTHCFSLLMLSFHDSCMLLTTLETVALYTPNVVVFTFIVCILLCIYLNIVVV
jgi:hypothetical protein